MIEFLVLVAVAALVAAYIALPRGPEPGAADGVEELRAEHRALLRQLRELDEDLAAGRIAADDRAIGRRAIGPRLRTVTESLRELGESPATGAAAAETSPPETAGATPAGSIDATETEEPPAATEPPAARPGPTA